MEITETKKNILEKDAEMIGNAINEFPVFDLPGALTVFMKIKGVNDLVLAERLKYNVSLIHGFRLGEAAPKGRNQLMEIGLGLSLDEREMNNLLLSQGYPCLYAKNLFDEICIGICRDSSDAGSKINAYRNAVKNILGAKIEAVQQDGFLSANTVNRAIQVHSEEDFEEWAENYAKKFVDFSKIVLPNKYLILYLMLFLGNDAMNLMYKTGELPPSIRNLLEPLILDRKYSPRRIRDKLIGFGLKNNLSDIDLDRLLDVARLRRFSNPETALEAAVLMALRQGHIRFPPYEHDYLSTIFQLLDAILKKSAENYRDLTITGQVQLGFFASIYEDIMERLVVSVRLDHDYISAGKRGFEENTFEKLYTSYSGNKDNCLAAYVKDIAAVLEENGDVDKAEYSNFVNLIRAEGV
ncbi:MAG: hypothetical protein LBD71_03655 [Treponema sp.]|jgi:hypothetical protein|nr:hypothetical protein [Treponema sp.]